MMNAQPWHAERPVTAELARDLIESQFPDLAPARIEFLAQGWDNTVYRVNEALVFRFPRRELAVPLIETERRLLPFLGPQLPLPVPVPRYFGAPVSGYPWPFLGYGLLPGRTVPGARLATEQFAAMAEPLGRFLAALHRIPAEVARQQGAGPDLIDRMRKAEGRLPALRADIEQLTLPELRPLVPTLLAIVGDWPAGYLPKADTLIHSDLHAEQLLVDEDGRLTAIIDWGDAHLGDPALDIAGVLALLPPEAFPVFEAAYGPVDPVTLRVARIRAIRHTLHGLEYAADTGDGQLLAEMVRALRCLAGRYGRESFPPR